jgi:SAM-dependent methyltransferase
MPTFEQPELVEFFSGHRNRPEDLYPSERRFLPGLAAGAKTVLDVGCAAGGFVDIWRAFNGALRYTGVDLSESLVAAARRLHPHAEFLVGDCAVGLSLSDRAADVVAALGWLHWEPRYADALRELWRLTGHSLFFDVRLHDGSEDLVGAQAIPGGRTTYLCASWPRLRRLLLDLEPGSIRGYGYVGPPADTVSGMPTKLCFAAFVLERGDLPTDLSLDLPFTNGGMNA